METLQLEKDIHLQEILDEWMPFIEQLPNRDVLLDLSDYPNSRYLSINFRIINPQGFELITTYRQRVLSMTNLDINSVRSRLLVSPSEGIKANGPFIDTRSGRPQAIYIPASRKDSLKSISRFQIEYLNIINGSVTHALYTLVRGYNILYQLNELD